MKYNRVFAFGDSFTYGHELSDCPPNTYPTPSNLSYGALVANELSAEYHCYAIGSYANNAISRRIIEALPILTQNDIALVMWTFTIRHELLLEGDAGWRSLAPLGTMPIEKEYFKYIDIAPHYHIGKTLKEIYISQQLLTAASIPHIFMSSVTDLSQEIQSQENILSTKLNLDKWIFLDNDLGFVDWSRNILNIHFGGHPPDTAHQALAKKILDKIHDQP
jgi:hypothetical protein